MNATTHRRILQIGVTTNGLNAEQNKKKLAQSRWVYNIHRPLPYRESVQYLGVFDLFNQNIVNKKSVTPI